MKVMCPVTLIWSDKLSSLLQVTNNSYYPLKGANCVSKS